MSRTSKCGWIWSTHASRALAEMLPCSGLIVTCSEVSRLVKEHEQGRPAEARWRSRSETSAFICATVAAKARLKRKTLGAKTKRRQRIWRLCVLVLRCCLTCEERHVSGSRAEGGIQMYKTWTNSGSSGDRADQPIEAPTLAVELRAKAGLRDEFEGRRRRGLTLIGVGLPLLVVGSLVAASNAISGAWSTVAILALAAVGCCLVYNGALESNEPTRWATVRCGSSARTARPGRIWCGLRSRSHMRRSQFLATWSSLQTRRHLDAKTQRCRVAGCFAVPLRPGDPGLNLLD